MTFGGEEYTSRTAWAEPKHRGKMHPWSVLGMTCHLVLLRRKYIRQEVARVVAEDTS